MSNNIIKNKNKGRNFESYLASIFRNLGFYIIKTGVSTAGVDLYAFSKAYINQDEVIHYVIIAELKNQKNKLSKTVLNKIMIKLNEEGKNILEKASIIYIPILINYNNKDRVYLIYIFDYKDKVALTIESKEKIINLLEFLKENIILIIESLVDGKLHELRQKLIGKFAFKVNTEEIK